MDLKQEQTLIPSSDYVRKLLKQCCRGGCQAIPGHRCDRPSALQMEDICDPGRLDPHGPLARNLQAEIESLSSNRLTRNNKVRLLLDGTDSYGTMLDLIRSAENEVCFENFIFRADAVGLAFAAEFRRRAEKDRVQVRILHEPFGSRLSVLPIAWRFRGSGALVRLYNPLPAGAAFFTLGRDHRKLVLQDRSRLVAGGLCLADVWLGNCITQCTWRDSAILAEGDCASAAAQEFDRLWHHGVSLTLRRPRPQPRVIPATVGHAGEVPVRIVADFRNHRPTEQILLLVCEAAQHEILITNQYFIPTPALVRALIEAVRRGVDVKLILPRLGRPLIAGLATDHYLGRFLASGIKIWRWNGPMMHAKTITVDRSWSLVGSSNVDPLSLRFNAELNLEVHGTSVGEQMATIFDNDLLTSTLYTYEDWRSRSVALRGLTRLASLAGPIL